MDFVGRDKLFARVKELYYGISRSRVMEFLNNNSTNQIHSKQKLAKYVKPIVVKSIKDRITN